MEDGGVFDHFASEPAPAAKAHELAASVPEWAQRDLAVVLVFLLGPVQLAAEPDDVAGVEVVTWQSGLLSG